MRRWITIILLLLTVVAEPLLFAQQTPSRRRPFRRPRRAASQPASRPASQPGVPTASGPVAASRPLMSPEQEAETAISLVDEDRLNEAVMLARSSLKRQERPGVSLFAMAYALDAVGRSYEAMEYARRYVALEVGKNDWRAHALMGSILLRSKNYLTARRALDEAEKLVPRDKPLGITSIASNKAEALIALNERSEAEKTIRAVRAAIMGYPDVGLWLAYGRVLHSCTGWNADVEEAFGFAARVAANSMQRAKPDDMAPVSDMIACLRTSLEVLEAEVKSIREALKNGETIDPIRVKALPLLLSKMAIGSTRLIDVQRRARLIDALGFCRQALEIDDANLEANLTLAQLQTQLSDMASAEQTLLKVLKIDPGNKEAQQMITIVRKAIGGKSAASAPAGNSAPGAPAQSPPASPPDTPAPPPGPAAAVAPVVGGK